MAKVFGSKRKKILLLSIAVLAVLSLFIAAVILPVKFTHGVASGDVTSDSAVLLARVIHSALLTLQVSTDPSFRKLISKMK
jgi:phosphodiesterase/alkaline phosphatase D-like protein